jgi:membrane-associated protein
MNPLLHLDLSAPVSYLAAFFLPASDAIVPLVPSEAAVITLGVATTGSADVRIGVLLLLVVAGAWTGDNLCYALGRRFEGFIDRHVFAGERGARRRAWAQSTLARRGAALIVVCRFIPGGRTAVTITCGATSYPRRTFRAATAVAAVLWASYAFALGRLGGSAFENQPWAGLLLALGIALLATAVIEGFRRLRSWQRHRAGRRGQSEPSSTDDPETVSAGSPPAVSMQVSLGIMEPRMGRDEFHECAFCELRVLNGKLLHAHEREDSRAIARRTLPNPHRSPSCLHRDPAASPLTAD